MKSTEDFQIDGTSEFLKNVSRFFAQNKIYLPNFQKDEIDTIYRHSIANTGVTFSDNIIDMVYETTKGHPFTTQLLFAYLYENQNGGMVNQVDFEKANESYKNDVILILKEIYGELKDNQKTILKIISEQVGKLDIKAIKHILVENNFDILVPEVEVICSSLEKLKIVKKNIQGNYELVATFYKELAL